jgi:hypothetical protein
MAKVRLNPILEQLRGQVGDLVFKRYGKRVIISRKPDVEGQEWSEAQTAHRERFRQAAIYGKMVSRPAGEGNLRAGGQGEREAGVQPDGGGFPQRAVGGRD